MMPADLHGLRVLVTRPVHQAKALCDKLQQQGAIAVAFPTLEILPIAPEDPSATTLRQHFLDLDHYHAVLFVSANAAHYAFQWIDSYWPQLPLGVHWLAVGNATAARLQQLGIPCSVQSGSMDSEALLKDPRLQQLEHTKILICRGDSGRELLRDTLISRGATVDYAELYRRQRPRYSQAEIESRIYQSPPSAMLVSSGEALSNLFTLTGQRPLLDQILVVPSQRVAEQARTMGFKTVVTAANATDDAMITALVGVVSTATSKRG